MTEKSLCSIDGPGLGSNLPTSGPGRRPAPAQADIEKPRCRAPPAALAEAGGKLSTCVATSLAPLGFSKGRVVKGQNVSRSEYKHWASPGPATSAASITIVLVPCVCTQSITLSKSGRRPDSGVQMTVRRAESR